MKARRQIVRRSPAFADAISDAIENAKSKGWMVATVTNLSPLTVTAFGTDFGPMSRLASYTPALGDVVLVAVSGQQTIIHGKIVS